MKDVLVNPMGHNLGSKGTYYVPTFVGQATIFDNHNRYY